MRIACLVLVLAGCGGSGNKDTHADAPGGDAARDGSAATAPTIIPGGGIQDSPIAGVAYIYAIDDNTRLPIAGASVAVGGVTGTTDATGLFTANGVTGPQDVVVVATGYRAEAWDGANGANITIDLQTTTPVTPPSANLSGTIDLSSFTVAAGHVVAAIVTYSQDEDLGDPANSIATANGTNVCFVSAPPASQSCAFTVTSRVGAVGVVAAIVDHAGSGDGTNTVIGWAYTAGLSVTAGSDQTGVVLGVVPSDQLTAETFSFDTPPAGLSQVDGIAGIDIGSAAGGVFELPIELTPSGGTASLLVPQLAVIWSSTYTFTGVAQQAGSGSAAVPESVVLVRGQTGATISAGTWLAPPTNVSASLTQASWTPSSGALVESVAFAQGSASLLNITAFDGRTTVDVPASVTLPSTGGTLTATVSALAGSIDLTDFSLDQDRDELTGDAAQPSQVSN